MDKEYLLHFIAVLCEYIWQFINGIRHGTPAGNWTAHFSKINSKARQYWEASFKLTTTPQQILHLKWTPLPVG